MAEVSFNRLKGDVDRLEREISNVNRSINTNKKFVQGVDYSEEFRAKKSAELKEDQKTLKDLKARLQEATKSFNDFVQKERAAKGKKDVSRIESEYARLEKALSLQLDPNSKSAKDIKGQIDDLVDEYASAVGAVQDRAVNRVEARSKLTKNSSLILGTGTAKTKTPTPTPTPKPEVTPKSGVTPKTGNTITGNTKDKTTTPYGPNDPAVPYTDKQAADLANTVGGTNYFEAKYGKATDTTGSDTPLNTLLEKTDFWYDLPDYIFKVDVDPKTGEPGEIGRLLQEAVTGNWENPKFLAKLQLTKWWQRNAPALRERIIDREKYNDLKAAGEDVSKTEYGIYLGKQMRTVKAKAKELAGVTLTDEQAQSVAQKIYDGFLDDDPLAINALIVPFIGKTSSIVGNGLGAGAGTSQTGFSGQALQNYQTLQGIAKANGFSLKDILPNVSAITAGGDLETAVMRGLADGSIDINRVAQDARMLASQGQPQYVRNLLNQGYDLEAVYAPYRRTMANELELQPDEIDLNDPTLRMAITDKGDMNLYDFKKAIRKDNRWQYTGTAKEEVSNVALGVLRDFGFQG